MPYLDSEKKNLHRRERRSLLLKDPVCLFCGKKFVPKQADRITYCSRECSYSAIQAVKIARLHWLVIEKQKKYRFNCKYCGEVVESKWSTANTCKKCRSKSIQAIHSYMKKNKDIYERIRICSICDKSFTKQYGHKISNGFCSKECKIIAKKALSRRSKLTYEMRKRASYVEPVWRNRVYARDGYRCGICGRKIARDKKVPHPMAATLDHIVPISLGGEHSYANIRTAHFECNWKRGNKVNPNGEQQFMF